MLWQVPTSFPALLKDQVHIWRASLVRSPEERHYFATLLNPQEKERAAKLVTTQAANNFIVARGILRQLLAQYLQLAPESLVFKPNPWGKLYLETSAIQFNLSHSHELGLFIFTWQSAVGIDVELIRNDCDFAALALRFFSQKEITALLELPPGAQSSAFFNCWTRKEALIKAMGVGLFAALDKFSVEVNEAAWGKLKFEYLHNKLDTRSWVLEALQPHNKYAGACVIGRSTYALNFYDF